ETVASSVADSDRAQAPGRVLGLLAGRRVDQRALLRKEHECSPRREASPLQGDVDRALRVARAEGLGRADVENRGLELVAFLEWRRRAHERAAIELDDSVEVRRTRRARQRRRAHELVLAARGEHGVEPALEADRGRGLGAHRGPAERARNVTREDLDAVGKLEQALQAGKELARAVDRLDGKIRTGGVADEEGVA